jgi:hypothetical protein
MIPAIGPLQVSIRQPQAPRRVSLEPGGQPLPFTYRDGEIYLTTPTIAVHRVIVLTP